VSFSDDDEGLAEALLVRVAGLDLSDPQEKDTARRFVKALKELTTPVPFEFTIFDSNSKNMVVVKDIPFATLCRHHVLPFMGVAHLGYVPNGKIAGLSKIPRLIGYHAAGLNTQEELTDEIADDFIGYVEPLGVAVVMEAQHTCMGIRGVKSTGTTRTMSVRGVLADHTRTAKMEFLEAIR
jgi:GTP cyclohydrolase IA